MGSSKDAPSPALDRLAVLGPACHRDVPDVNGVYLSVLVAHAGWIILSDSGPVGDRLEDLQVVLGEGPRLDAVATGGPVAVTDLAHPRARARWPCFCAPALAGGVRAVFAFPVHLDAVPVGVLNVYRATAARPSTQSRSPSRLPVGSGTCRHGSRSSAQHQATPHS